MYFHIYFFISWVSKCLLLIKYTGSIFSIFSYTLFINRLENSMNSKKILGNHRKSRKIRENPRKYEETLGNSKKSYILRNTRKYEKVLEILKKSYGKMSIWKLLHLVWFLFGKMSDWSNGHFATRKSFHTKCTIFQTDILPWQNVRLIIKAFCHEPIFWEPLKHFK